MNWDDANNACQELSAYGYDDWFLPSMGEFDAARTAGYIWYDIWSSTPSSTAYYAYILRQWEGAWWYEWHSYYGDDKKFKVIPMRKQAAMTSK